MNDLTLNSKEFYYTSEEEGEKEEEENLYSYTSSSFQVEQNDSGFQLLSKSFVSSEDSSDMLYGTQTVTHHGGLCMNITKG